MENEDVVIIVIIATSVKISGWMSSVCFKRIFEYVVKGIHTASPILRDC